jgi:long-chain acyl-CoA synthetase
MVTHKNILVALEAARRRGFEFFSSDVYLSYLPLAHMMERIFVQVLLMNGAAVGFYNGDALKIKSDMEVL